MDGYTKTLNQWKKTSKNARKSNNVLKTKRILKPKSKNCFFALNLPGGPFVLLTRASCATVDYGHARNTLAQLIPYHSVVASTQNVIQLRAKTDKLQRLHCGILFRPIFSGVLSSSTC